MKKGVKIILIILVLAIALFLILNLAFPNFFANLSLTNAGSKGGELATLSGSPALISWLKLNEGSGTTTYDSVGGSAGRIAGATWATGVSGSALFFNGSSYVNFNNQLGNFRTYDFSVGFWLKTSSARIEFPISKRVGCSCANFWNVRTESNGKISFEVSEASCKNYAMLTADKVINDNKWHHVLAQRKDNILSIYVDGVLSKSKNISGITNLDNTAVFRLGKSGCANPFTGSVDEVKFWNYALTYSEILDEYHQNANLSVFNVTREIVGNDVTLHILENIDNIAEEYETIMIAEELPAGTNIVSSDITPSYIQAEYRVGGNITPDATGDYAYAGQYNGYPYYKHVSKNFWVFKAVNYTGYQHNTSYYISVWAISNRELKSGTSYWTLSSENLIGSYTPNEEASGTATVSKLSNNSEVVVWLFSPKYPEGYPSEHFGYFKLEQIPDSITYTVSGSTSGIKGKWALRVMNLEGEIV